jgi:hypothetical protein
MMETKFTKSKIAAAIGSATLAMTLSGPANAVVVVGGDNGWEVSFDGEINQFYTFSDYDALPANATRVVAGVNPSGAVLGGALNNGLAPTRVADPSLGAGNLAAVDESRMQTGLLPLFYSFNVKSPTVNGLTGGARFSFAPQTQNPHTETAFGAQIDFREGFLTVDGSWGQILAGRTLSLFLGQNILTDQTLFGVGANIPQNGGTTLGRIGYGYVYPQFNSQVRYTSPDMNGAKIKVALFDTSRINGESGQTYIETPTPKFEGEGSYATTFTNGAINLWVNGMWQEAERPGTQTAATIAGGQKDDVTASGWSVGANGNWAGFELMGSYYDGKALGTTFMLDVDSVDAQGVERDNSGFIIQGGYNFFGKAKLLASYGQSTADETTNDKACRTGVGICSAAGVAGAGFAGARLKSQSMFTVGMYYDVNSWLKLVAEYNMQEDEWHDGTDLEADIFALGGFFFW